MNYIKQYFNGAKPATDKYKEDYLTIKNYFDKQGYITIPTRPYLHKNAPDDKYYKHPVTQHSFNEEGEYTDDFAKEGLEMGEIGLAVYPRESKTNKGTFLSIIDVDSLTGLELTNFKRYLDERNLPYINSKKGVHVYGTSQIEIKGRNGVEIQVGDFTIKGEIRSGGSGYCLTAPSCLIKEDGEKGNYKLGSTSFMELIALEENIPEWDEDILNVMLNIGTNEPGRSKKVEDMMKVLKGTERGRGDGVYDINLREVGRIIRNIKKKKKLDDSVEAKKGLEKILSFNKKHKKGYPNNEVEKVYWDVYQKELSKEDEIEGKKEKKSPVEIDLELLQQQGIKIVTDKNTSEVYIRVEGSTNMMLGSDECTRWITNVVEPKNVSQIKNIEMRLNAMSEEQIDIRSRVSKNGSMLYNLNVGGKIIRVDQANSDRGTEGKWEIIEDYGLERFKTVTGESPQVIPDSKSSVDDVYKLFDYMNTEEELKPLIICVLISYLTPDIAYPILNVYGEKGSGKSTMASFIKRLIDPNEVLLDNSEFKKEDDLIIALNNGHLTVFDNIRRITPDFGDMLTKVSTGIGFRGRTLFTNKGVTTFTFKKPIVITSVAQEMQREDLLSRSILVESLPFDGNIIPESDLVKNFKSDSDKILGSLFTILSKVDVSSVPRGDLIRLTDFHLISRSVEKVMGWEEGIVDKLLKNNMNLQEEESFENSLIGEEIKEYIDSKMDLPFEVSTSDLYKNLCIKNDKFDKKIKSQRYLGRELSKIRQTMGRLGYEIRQLTYVNGENKRGWFLNKK